MAYGSGAEGDAGEWSYKPPKKEESQEPAAHPPTPPAVTSPPAQSNNEVTPETINDLARSIFPRDKQALEFSVWRREHLAAIVEEVIRKSGINPTDFKNQLVEWEQEITKIIKDLNKKDVGDSITEAKPCPELPGGCNEPTCQSLFDVNDLAIRGRKAVTTRRFYFPLIFPEVRLVDSQKWGLGQKVEYDQEWRHDGFTLGGFISSFSLLPGEEVTFEVSSWQKTKSEVQQEQDDTKRQALEHELKKTDEQTISNEAANENGWSISATASVSYGPVSASATAGANGSSSDRVSEAQRHVQESTAKATSEESSRRAVKITHTTESQTEQKSVRRIKNPNQCHTVTFNFFQVVKLIDMQMRFINDAPVLYFPGLFPARYSNGNPVRIPYEVVEAFTSPALFLTQYFDVDRDISQEIHGFALRVRADVGRNPQQGLLAIAEALAVAVKSLLGLDPAGYVAELGKFLNAYATAAIQMRKDALKSYGKDRGSSLQINTSGVYVDSLLGRCSACEDNITSEKYVGIMRADAEKKQIEATNALIEAEGMRRRALLDKGILDSFDMTEAPSP